MSDEARELAAQVRSARSSGPSEGGFLPVQTGTAPVPAVPAAASVSPPSEPVLVTPRGYRVEGLDVERLLAVLERLG